VLGGFPGLLGGRVPEGKGRESVCVCGFGKKEGGGLDSDRLVAICDDTPAIVNPATSPATATSWFLARLQRNWLAERLGKVRSLTALGKGCYGNLEELL